MAGYSEIPLAKKLGIKPGIKAFFHSPPESVLAELKPALIDVELTRARSSELDFASTLSDTVVRDVGLKKSLVDIKDCAIDERWSGLKFVYRKGNR